MNFKLVDCDSQYWEFVRLLRQDDRVINGFIENISISREQQSIYMGENAQYYKIALVNGDPAGYVGVIDRDIRICTHPTFQGIGLGKFMIDSVICIWPESIAKVKIGNISSERLFISCGFEMVAKDEAFSYFKKYIK
jgi:hypothetical protein